MMSEFQSLAQLSNSNYFTGLHLFYRERHVQHLTLASSQSTVGYASPRLALELINNLEH